QRVDPLHRILDLLVVEVGADDVENFVIPQRGKPPSFGFEAPIERRQCASGRGQKGQVGILPILVMASRSRSKSAKAARKQLARPRRDQGVPLLPIVVGGILGVLTIAMIAFIVYLNRPGPAPQSVSGIACDHLEHSQVHYHAALQIVYQGNVVNLPDNTGIQLDSTGNVSCYYWLHVHGGEKNVIHIESPASDTFSLGPFVQVWNAGSQASGKGPQKLDSTHVSTFPIGATDKVVTYVDLGDGKGATVYDGDPSKIVLKQHEVITIAINPATGFKPPAFTFPSG